jgi:minor extracellular serine protease Vpr
MKKALLIFAGVSFVLLSMIGGNNLSPRTILLLRQHNEKVAASRPQSRLCAATIRSNGEEMVSAFIALSNNSQIDSLCALGVKVNCRFGNIITARIPIDRLNELSRISYVRQIAAASVINVTNDSARFLTNTDMAQSGAGLSMPFTGKGVIVGVIDIGIDFNHVEFCDSTGKSRVKRVYMPDDSTGVHPIIGSDTLPGSEYVTEDAIKRLSTDTKTMTHGTHTTSTAAGSYKGNKYWGMAPESDLVLCGLSELSDVNIADAAAYIMNYAKTVGKPAVINISLAGNAGNHDGSSFLCRAFDAVSGEGKIIVLAAGNDASFPLHLNKTFASETDSLCTFLFDSSGRNSRIYGYLDLWSRSQEPVSLQIGVYDMTDKKLVYKSESYIGNNEDNGFVLDSNKDSQLAKYFKGKFMISARVDSINGKYDCLTEFADTAVSARYCAGLIYKAKAGTEVNGWIDGSTRAESLMVNGWSLGNGECSISDIATGFKTISVGAYGDKKIFTGIATNWTYPRCNIGDITYFSSYGPDLNGTMRPEITAPGFAVVSGISNYDTATIVRDHASLIEEKSAFGRMNRWGEMYGTSMSAPVVTGIIALWLQANPMLTPDSIKAVMAATSVRDSYVTNGDQRRWGYGKIDALKGLKYITAKSGISMARKDNNQIIVYPNPSSGQFSITLPNNEGAEMGLYGIGGNLILSKVVPIGINKMDFDLKVSRGLYIVKVRGTNASWSSKLIIE